MTRSTIPGIRLFAITDTAKFPDCILQAEEVCQLARAGTVAVTLREREVSANRLYDWARHLRAVTERHEQHFFVADRLDVAVLVGADGVHLPSVGLRPAGVPDSAVKWVSRSGHELEALGETDFERVTSFWVSPVAAERKGRRPLGETGLRERIRWIGERAPHAAVYALGGIDAGQVPLCERAGAAGVAAIGAVWDPRERPRLLGALGIER